MDRTYIMDDKDFWLDLEFRLSGDLQSSDAVHMRRYWIDGFLPTEAMNTKHGVVVCGRVWMAEHASGRQDQWDFQVSIPQNMLHKPIRAYDYQITVFDESEMKLSLEMAKKAAQQTDPADRSSHSH